jgi:hypothetical protein
MLKRENFCVYKRTISSCLCFVMVFTFSVFFFKEKNLSLNVCLKALFLPLSPPPPPSLFLSYLLYIVVFKRFNLIVLR